MARRRRQAPPDAETLLGPLEYAAFRALWRGAPASVSQVRERINAERPVRAHLAYTTVMTVLGRLHDKGLLDRERRGRGYVYTPRHDEDALVDALGRRDVDRLVDRYGEVALAHFVDTLSEVDPELLRRVVALAEGRDA